MPSLIEENTTLNKTWSNLSQSSSSTLSDITEASMEAGSSSDKSCEEVVDQTNTQRLLSKI